jgi:hypothetical protein
MFRQTHSRLLSLGKHYETKTRSVTASELTKIIRRQFPATDFSFKTHRDYAVDPDMIVVSGFYDCYNDSQGLPHTEITLSYHPEQDVYFLHLLNWDRISFDIAECVGHEMVHRHQYLTKQKGRRYISENADQAYLGDDDEIDAYGFSIAAESVVYKKPLAECAMYQVYLDTFDTDQSVIVKLEKHISKYLKQLELQYEQTN